MSIRREASQGRSRAQALPARALSQAAVLLGALVLFAQLLALPYHHPDARLNPAEVVASLKANFGDAAVLCVTADDGSVSTSPEHRKGHCDDGCPLCQFGAQTVLLDAPPPALPLHYRVAVARLSALMDLSWERSRVIGLPQSRAPPAQV